MAACDTPAEPDFLVNVGVLQMVDVGPIVEVAPGTATTSTRITLSTWGDSCTRSEGERVYALQGQPVVTVIPYDRQPDRACFADLKEIKHEVEVPLAPGTYTIRVHGMRWTMGYEIIPITVEEVVVIEY